MNAYPHTDSQIQHAIVKSLDWSPGVRAEHIAVAVTDGAVTLAGEAVDLAEKDAALRAASEVAGVVAVVDEIEIRGTAAGLNDADIARTATDAIEASPALRHQNVTATVHDRVVTLAGVVEEPDQRNAAERVAYGVPGVRAVVNDLRVLPRPSSAETRQRIAEALMHGVDSEIEHLAIEVADHTATLNGTVHSWYERRAAEQAARTVPGVTTVDNNLTVSY